jgi:hypothetical protein
MNDLQKHVATNKIVRIIHYYKALNFYKKHYHNNNISCSNQEFNKWQDLPVAKQQI